MEGLANHLVAVQFKPDSRFMDRKGEWTREFEKMFGTAVWQVISDTRIDLRSADRRESFFLSHSDCGHISLDPPNLDTFVDRTTQFLGKVFSLPNRDEPFQMTRLGVRSRFAAPTEMTFPELRERFRGRYMAPSSAVINLFGGSLLDIGAPLNFQVGDVRINTLCGPMEKAQIAQFMERDLKDIEMNVGLFFDIDQFRFYDLPTDVKSLAARAKELFFNGLEKHKKVVDIVLSESS